MTQSPSPVPSGTPSWRTSDRDSDAHPAREIQLLVHDEGNRRALSKLLQQEYRVDRSEELRDVDLYIVDDRTLPSYRDDLVEQKRKEHPTFCPVVLIRREDTRVNVELPDAESANLPTIIDDIVAAPVDKQLLFRRLSNLLVRRSQSIAQARQYEESEARFEGLFHSIPDPAFVLNGEQMILQVNDAFCRKTGLRREWVINRSPTALAMFPDDTIDKLASLLEDGSDASDEDVPTVAFEDASGNERRAELLTREQTVQGESIMAVVMHDVTELAEKNDQLERFASIVTHDLRNPLQVARGQLQILNVPEEHEDYLDMVLDSLDRMDEIIEGVRTLVGDTELGETEPIDFEEVVREAWQNAAIGEATLDLDADDVSIVADRHRILQLLENLFRNAVEHGSTSDQSASDAAGDHDGQDVTVRVTANDDGFAVGDNGSGIPPEERDDVFESGYTTTTGGTGLGLVIVSEIVDAHEWTVTVTESTAGGARFEIGDVDVRPGA